MTGWVWLSIGLFAAAWALLRRIQGGRRIADFRERGAIVVDVRTPAEFKRQHAPGALNLPLDALTQGMKGLDKSKPVLLCCASGARSSAAARILRERGFETFNAGSWTRLC